MSAIRHLPKHESNTENLGLTAIGSAGRWEVAIDESIAGATQKWFAQIEGHSVYLYFGVQSPRVIDKMLAFLTKRTISDKGSQATVRRNGEIVIGNSKEERVVLVRDEEFSDRYFLIAETKKKLVVRVTIGGSDLNCLVTALRQAKEDLDEAETD